MLVFIPNLSLKAQNDLQFYINSAIKNNPFLKESANNIRIKNLDKSINEAEYILPQVNFTANYLFVPYFNNDKVVTVNPQPDAVGYDASVTNGGLYSAQINVSKSLFNGGTAGAYNNQADIQIRSNETSIELLKHNLEKDVTDQYINCWQAQELYTLSKTTADTLKQQLDITERLMLKGLGKQSDYLILKVEFRNQELTAVQALNSLKSSIYQLNTFAGIKDTSILLFNPVDLNKSEYSGPSKFFNQYVNDSLLILSQQDIFETKYYPQLSAFFNAGLNAVELNDIQRKFGLSAGLNFSLPIYDGGQKSITRQQSQISLSTINSNRANQEVIIKNKIKESSALADYYNNALLTIGLQIKDYNTVLSLSRGELMKGQLSMIEYITIIKNYLDLKKTEISSAAAWRQAVNQYNYWNW
jgi:outer membrane protein TolC